MRFYRRLLCVSWTKKRINRSILEEPGEERQLLELVIRRNGYTLAMHAPGKWTNEIDVPWKSSGKNKKR